MKRRLTMIAVLAVVWVALSMQPEAQAVAPPAPKTPPAAPAQAAGAKATTPRAMELADILAWKSAAMTLLSTDGRWLAYRLSPLDGDSEIVVRQTQGEKEYRFPVGDARGTPGQMAVSEDARWVAFSVAPTKKEAAQLRRTRRPAQNKVTILNLADGSTTTIEKIQRFAFAGEKAAWIAMKKYGADAPAGGAATAPSGPPAPGGAAAAGSATDDRPKGGDLILHELATGVDLNVGNVNEFAFDKSGRFLAVDIDAADKLGNGVVLHDMQSGVTTPLDTGKASYERLAWTEKGDGLAVLKGTEDKKYKDKVYAVIAFTKFGQAKPEKIVYDPATDKTFPEGMSISPNRTPSWTEDLSAIYFGIRTLKKSDAKPDPKADPKAAAPEGKPETPPVAADAASDEEKPNLILWHYKDSRLQSQQQVQEAADKNFSYASVYRVAEKKFIRLADDALRSVSTPLQGQFAMGNDVREYELSGNLDGRNYRDVYVVNLKTGERKLALKKARWVNQATTDGTKFLYYEDGHFFVYDMASGQSTNITKLVPTSFINTEDDHNVVKPPRGTLGWTKAGDEVLLSDGWDIWKVAVTGGSGTNLTVNGKKDGIRYRSLQRLDPEERGWDLSVPRYVNMFGEFTKKGGFGRLEPGKPGVQPLLWDDASFGMQKAKKADVYLYTKSTPNAPQDYYVTDASLKPGKKITALRRTGEELPVVERRADRRLHGAARQGRPDGQAAGLAVPAGELREGQELPDAGLHLREADERALRLHHAVGERLQQDRLHEQRLCGADARHHLQAERPGDVGGVVPDGGRQGGGRHRRRRSEAHRAPGAFVGRIPDGVHGHADRSLCRRHRRRAADEHGQHVQSDLQEQRRDEPGDLRE